MDEEHKERRTRSIEIGVIVTVATFGLALLGQTAAVAWGAASISAKLDFVATQVTELKADRYSQSDARRDMLIEDAKTLELAHRIQRIEDALGNGLKSDRER